MGRRVTSSTKGGRYMNPADQERKVTRRRELKKNKKQRQLVRQAVLKSKDPQQILEEMEKLDKMEFDPHEEPPISERVIQEKRGKLRETYVRVMLMYEHEDQKERYEEMRKNLHEYDRRKVQMEQHYIAVKFTREVDPGDIPLPDAAPPLLDGSGMPLLPFPPHMMLMPGLGGGYGTVPPMTTMPGSIPSHFFGKSPVHGILKKKQKSSAPGVPIGPPPELSDDENFEEEERHAKRKRAREDLEDVDSGEEGELLTEGTATTSEVTVAGKTGSRVRFDDPEDGGDQDEKDTRTKYKQLAKKIAAGENIDDPTDEQQQTSTLVTMPNAGFGMAPPPVRSLMRPVGPTMPPRLLPPMPPFGFPPRSLQPGMRMLPPPPAFLRGAGLPRMFPPIGPVPIHPLSSESSASIASGPVLSAPPTVNKLPKAPAGPTIEAKPQLRNMQNEIKKFVPTGVKIKHERAGSALAPSSGGNSAAASANKQKGGHIVFRVATTSSVQANQRAKAKTTDDAYEEFMNEMKELM